MIFPISNEGEGGYYNHRMIKQWYWEIERRMAIIISKFNTFKALKDKQLYPLRKGNGGFNVSSSWQETITVSLNWALQTECKQHNFSFSSHFLQCSLFSRVGFGGGCVEWSRHHRGQTGKGWVKVCYKGDCHLGHRYSFFIEVGSCRIHL